MCRIQLARWLSGAFQPTIVSVALLLAMALAGPESLWWRLKWFLVCALLCTVIPVGFVLLGIRLGRAQDLDLRARPQRPIPLAFALICVVIAVLLVSALDGPTRLRVALLAGLAPGVALALITTRWKISFHSATLAGATVVAWWRFGASALVGAVICVLVSWARLVLERHSVGQVIAGAAVGAGGSLLVVLLS